MKENRRFNRHEKAGMHFYSKDFGSRGVGAVEYTGYIKCKLAHTVGGSLIIPDQIYLQGGESLFWLQPLAFLANSIVKTPEAIDCLLHIDISLGHSVAVTFEAAGHLHAYPHGSHLYRCDIR